MSIENLSVKQGLLIGRCTGMEEAVTCFLQHCATSRTVQQLADLPDDDATAECVPQLVLVLQHWPEEYCRQDVEWLFNRYPLARFICCYGPWCSSDGRTRNAWPAAVRVPLSAVGQRIVSEVCVIQGERTPLEKTSGLDEIFAFENVFSPYDPSQSK